MAASLLAASWAFRETEPGFDALTSCAASDRAFQLLWDAATYMGAGVGGGGVL